MRKSSASLGRFGLTTVWLFYLHLILVLEERDDVGARGGASGIY